MSRRPIILSLMLIAAAIFVTPSMAQEASGKTGTVPILSDLPLLSSLFDKKNKKAVSPSTTMGEQKKIGLSVSPLRMRSDKAKAPRNYESSFLQQHQCQEILTRYKDVESVEIIETRKTKIERAGANVSAVSEIKITGTDSAKTEARQFLDEWARLNQASVALTYYLIELKDNPQERLPVVEFEAISKIDFEKALAAHRATKSSKVLAMPNLTVIQGQRATVSLLNEIAYVKDFDIEITSASYLADPIIDTIREGVVINTTAAIDFDGQGVALKIEAQVSSLHRPIQQFTTELVPSSGSMVTIQLPQISTATTKTDLLRLRGETMSFRFPGLRVLGGKNGAETIHYEVLGTAKIRN